MVFLHPSSSLFWMPAPENYLKAVRGCLHCTWCRRGNNQVHPHSVTLHLKHHTGFFRGRRIPNFSPICVTMTTMPQSSTSEFPSWKGVLHPVPVNLLSFGLRRKSVSQEGRAVTEKAPCYTPHLHLYCRCPWNPLNRPCRPHTRTQVTEWTVHPLQVHSYALNSSSDHGSFVHSFSQSVSKYLLRVYTMRIVEVQ